jgi:hypothetical protein
MGRLISEALYRPEDFRMRLQYDAEYAQENGDAHKLYHLEETFGIRPSRDEDLLMAVRRAEREDPCGIRTLVLCQLMEAESQKDEERVNLLRRVYQMTQIMVPADPFAMTNRFQEMLPITSRPTSPCCRDIVCLSLTGKSYFSFPKGESPGDKWLGLDNKI